MAPRRKRHGLTMAEVVISTLITGFILVGASRLIGGAVAGRMRSETVYMGTVLAQQLMTEVFQAPYDDPEEPGSIGRELGESGGDRADWDDLDDYDDWSQSPPEDKAGNAYDGYENWTREVTVQYVNQDDPNVIAASDQGLKRVTVTVSSPDGEVTTLVGLRSTAGSLQQPPNGTGTITVVTWVGCHLQLGDATPSVTGTNLLNHTFDE